MCNISPRMDAPAGRSRAACHSDATFGLNSLSMDACASFFYVVCTVQ